MLLVSDCQVYFSIVVSFCYSHISTIIWIFVLSFILIILHVLLLCLDSPYIIAAPLMNWKCNRCQEVIHKEKLVDFQDRTPMSTFLCPRASWCYDFWGNTAFCILPLSLSLQTGIDPRASCILGRHSGGVLNPSLCHTFFWDRISLCSMGWSGIYKPSVSNSKLARITCVHSHA